MIQIFLVDTGAMYQVDVSLQQPVSCLNEEIYQMSRIPVEKQVLLMSGGVPLFPEKTLAHYESFLDNPVYLICKSTISDVIKPPPGLLSYSDHDLTSQVEASAILPAALETVRSRTQLAQRICQIDRNELKVIEQLVYDQHLQQQGWAAVVANLEDLVSGFDKRACTFQKQFREFLKTRENILSLLRRMPEVLILLEKIPVLPCLENLASKTSVSLRGPLDMQPSYSSGKPTLYAWMNAQDSKHRLEDLIHDLTNGTNQMGVELEEKVNKEVQEVIQYASGPWPSEMKSIRGLEERLYGLDKLVHSAETTVEAQVNTSKGFEQNRIRLEAVKDNSILPDLCASHRKQMRDMLANHKKLLELKKKCADAKKELSDNLKQRLTWVMGTHHLVNDMDNKLVLYYDWLNRIHVRAEFLQQVERAPLVYAAMVVEVARRRLFSQHYMKWAKGVAEESKKEHKKEIHRRKSFTKQFGSHFLQKLFVGFKDNVPKFAAEVPKDIDSQLPDITAADVDSLAQSVPELRQQLRVPSGTGSPALASSFHQPLAADGGSDPLLIEVTQALASSTASFTTQSIMSVTQSVSESVDTGQVLLLEPAEHDRLSLSCQGAEERHELRLPADDKLFLSLQEKFPLVGHCLSESLTAEVNSAAMSTISANAMSASPKAQELSSALEELGQQQQQQQQQQHQDGGGDGVLFSSGDLEPAKSSDSDAVSHESLSEHKPRSKRRSGKGLSDTSPDAETSQEFTTADFYIEDSMPSSMTDSPPKPAGTGKDRGEVDAVLAEKTKRVGELEGEVSALQSKLAGSEEKLAGLQSVLNSDVITSMRESLAAVRKHVLKSDGERSQAVTEAQEAIVRACALLVENIEREKQESLGREREGSRQAVEGLETQLQAKCKLVDELQQGMLKVSNSIADVNKELQRVRDSSQKEMEALREKHAEELKEVSNKNMLVVELETDRVRAEMQQCLDKQDVEIQRLQQELELAESRLVEAQQEKDSMAEAMQRAFAQEKDQLREALGAEKRQALEEFKAAMAEEEKARVETMMKEDEERKGAEMQTRIQELECDHEKRMREKESDHEKRMREKEEEMLGQHSARLESLEAEWAAKLASQQQELRKELEDELERTKVDLQAARQPPSVSEQGTQSEGGEIVLLEHHQELLTQAEAEAREQVTQQYEKLLEEEREKWERKQAELEHQHQKDLEEALQNFKTSVVAERQIQFNEAITRAVQEKDRLIEDLRAQLDQMASVTDQEREGVEYTQGIREELADIKQKESQLQGEKRHLEDEVLLLQRQLRQYSEQLHSMTASAAPISPSFVTDGASMPPSDTEEAVALQTDWEQVANLREQKINELEGKLMSMSMTTSVRKEVRDKVSILTCNVGDLVLLCLDDRHNQYVVFTVGTTLHFLHSDCLDSLGLRSAEGELRRNWVLAEVTEREYCLAKKPQNRFKVPVDTKFYRVKAKAWSPGGSSSS